MPCTCPLDAYPAPPGAADRRPVWSPHQSYVGARPIRFRCGQCMGCRLDRSQDWATRIDHEAALHEDNVFLTPTYSDEHLPADRSVSVRTHQLFIKRLRKRFGPLRFFGCGEYGEGAGKRPHYHTIVFGLALPDKTLWRTTPNGNLLYRSKSLEEVWPFGHILFGDVTHESAAYVARYCTKKLNGERAADAYKRSEVVPETGEIREWQVEPEFAVMSRRPGLGSDWFQLYAGDCFPSDFLIIDGRKVPVPNYYKAKLAELEQLKLTAERKSNALKHADNNTERRLMTRHESQLLRAERLKRSLEMEQ